MAAQQFKACDPVLDDGQDKQSENHGAFGGGLNKTIDDVQKPARNQVKGSYHRSDSQEAAPLEKHSQRDHDSGNNVKTQPSLSVGTEQETSSPLEGDVAATLTRIKDHYSILSTPSESRSADSIAPSASVLEVPVKKALSAFNQLPQSISTSTQDKNIPVLENTPQQPATYDQAIDAPGPADLAVASGRDPQQGRDSAFSSVTGSSNERGEDDEFHHAGARAGDSSPDVLSAAASFERSLPTSARDRSSYNGRGEQAVGAKSSSAIAATARDDSGRPVARNPTPPNLPRPPLASSPAVSGNFQARAPVPGPPGVVHRPVAADLGIQRRDVQEGAGEGDLELQLGIRVRDPDGAVNLRRAREARRLACCLACWEQQPEVFLRDCGHHYLCRRCFMDPDQPGLLPGMPCPTCLRPVVAIRISREMGHFLYIRSTQPFFHAL